MKTTFQVNIIGRIKLIDEKFAIELYPEYISGLNQVEGFSHFQIVWWAHLTDNRENRKKLIAEKLFKNAPDGLGVFGTRSPVRPNPVMISTIEIDEIDFDKGILFMPFIDAEPGTPVLDIKPYFPMERLKKCSVPPWCSHWPEWAEDTVDFNWGNEINF